MRVTSGVTSGINTEIASKPGATFLAAAVAATAIAAVLVVLTDRSAARAAEPTRSQQAMAEIWGEMVGDGTEWRTPNPGFDDSGNSPREFAIRWRWDAYEQYAIGELLGIFGSGDDEKAVRYWDLYAFHNPVTGEVTGMQVGWDGSLASGPMRRTPDGAIVLDQILYNADGSMKALRHEDLMAPGRDRYESNVYERDERGEWALVREWTWTRHE